MVFHLLLFLGAVITSTLAQADEEYLNQEILPKCFEQPTWFNGILYVNGQTEPLANSLENFLSLVEKLELANPDMKLEDELFILLKNYTADNVRYQTTGRTPPYFGMLSIWQPNPAILTEFEKLWEPNQEKELPSHIDPFEKNEKCSLFFMLSHTVNETYRTDFDERSYNPGPDAMHFSTARWTFNPREQGVIGIHNSSSHAVALGRVLLGLYVGLKDVNERIKPVDAYGKSIKIDKVGDIRDVNILYLVTLADQLVISQFPLTSSSKALLGKNGLWKSVQSPTEKKADDFSICPTVYELLENNTSAYTFSSVRGGIDGLILGDVIRLIYNDQPDVRLTQILRMYYGRNGLQEKTNAPPSPGKISFCNRIDKMESKTVTLKEQMQVFVAFVSRLSGDGNIGADAYAAYERYKSDILTVDEKFRSYCSALQESKGTPKCEAAVDVIFVMDTTQKNVENGIKSQRMIIGHLANHLEMVHEGSTLTVFSDLRNGTSGLGLVTAINKTTSSACAACSAMRFQIDTNTEQQADKDFVIQSISEVLRKEEEEEKTLNGAKGKVVIFFNFEEEETVSYRQKRALRDLYMQHVGVQFFAIGNNKDVLKTYAQGQLQNVITVLDLQPHEIADILSKKICEVPSKLQYDDCKNRRNEAGAVYEGLITPNSIQRWAMYPKYFHKSFTPKMFFQIDSAESRQIEVCHSRAYSRAEDQKQHCRHTSTSERRLEFNTTNPCRTFNEHNCAPWYFTISVTEENSDENRRSNGQYCKDSDTLRCKTLDQVKFKVSHEGIQCNSASRLFSAKDLSFACLAAYIVMKLWNANK